VAASARIEELRERLAREPGSRLFAQLGEELRKAGELDEAVAVLRRGLEKQPNYPSARLTLGRALLEKGDAVGASHELRQVLRGAPDNILAARMLAESLEAQGQLEAALAQYRSTLALAAGEPLLKERVAALERRLAAAAPQPARLPAERAPQPADVPKDEEPEPAAIPLVDADESFELETSHEATRSLSPPIPDEWEPDEVAGKPIPLAAVDGAFEVESPLETVRVRSLELGPRAGEETGGTLPFQPHQAEAAPAKPPARQTEQPPRSHAQAQPAPVPVAPIPATPPPSVPPRGSGPQAVRGKPAVAHLAPEHAAAAMGEIARSSQTAPLTSVTLAELYVAQGALDKAIEAYSLLVKRDPGHPTANRRLAELRALAERPAVDPRVARRAAIERTIGRLEAFLDVVRRGAAS
jgi:tetratricopeptide (TPR) repeat protein